MTDPVVAPAVRPATLGRDPIVAIRVIDIALPVRDDWRWRGLHQTLGRWSIVRIETAEGVVGYGEATALREWGGDYGRYFGETPVTVRHLIETVFAPALIGHDPFDLELATAAMDEAVRGHPYAKAAVEMALYDLQGKQARLPVYKLLGGKVRAGVRIAHMIGITTVEGALGEAEACAQEGITAFQIKSAGELDRDVEMVAALRRLLGHEATLRLDANQGYDGHGVRFAIQAVQRLAEAGVDMVEQPTQGLRAMSAVRAASSVPIVADESCWQAQDVIEVNEAAAADALSVYIAKAGGVRRAKAVLTLAEVLGLPCDINGSLESGIGNAANVHVAVSSPRVTLACVIPVSRPRSSHKAHAGRYYLDDVVADEFGYADGFLFPPESPGLVTVDEEKLQAYTLD